MVNIGLLHRHDYPPDVTFLLPGEQVAIETGRQTLYDEVFAAAKAKAEELISKGEYQVNFYLSGLTFIVVAAVKGLEAGGAKVVLMDYDRVTGGYEEVRL